MSKTSLKSWLYMKRKETEHHPEKEVIKLTMYTIKTVNSFYMTVNIRKNKILCPRLMANTDYIHFLGIFSDM